MAENRGSQTITRRDLLKIGAITAASTAISLLGFKTGFFNDLSRIINESILRKKPEVWGADKLEELLNYAVELSIKENTHVIVTLPPGKTDIDRKITCEVKKGASIEINGKGLTSLNLNPALADIPKEWGSPQQNNMIEFSNVEGKVVVDGVNFDGGSIRAGKGGYQAPGGPWDAILYINGSGEGSGKRPEKYRGQTPKNGEAYVRNCRFYNTESAACLTKNLGYVEMTDCEGENFDAIWCAAWCDRFMGKNIKGKSSPSDILAFYVCNEGYLERCEAKNARQGFLFQGCRNFEAKGCLAEDCLKGYDLYQDGDRRDPCENMTFTNCDSRGSGLAYSIDYAKNVTFKNSQHELVGRWYDSSLFPRLTDIVDPGPFAAYPQPLWLGNNYNGIRFINVAISKDQQTKHKYSVPLSANTLYKKLGINLQGFN